MLGDFVRHPIFALFALLSRLQRSWRLVTTLCLTFSALLLATLLRTYYSQQILPVKPHDGPFFTGCQTPDVNAPRENATFFMLARNQDLEGAIKTLKSLDSQFNHWARYPIVFLNDDAWNQSFIDGVSSVASGRVQFGVVGQTMWGFPEWIDQDRARVEMDAQAAKGLWLAGNASYHHMCRFYSGMFYDHDLLRSYKWYWRIEPGVRFTCAITYDPFVEMVRRGKRYGYVIALWEIAETVPTLFRKISDWKAKEKVETTRLWAAMIDFSMVPWPIRSLFRILKHRDADGNRWNLCHFFNNFEIADMEFFRSSAYRHLFDTLDHDGGFYYERVRHVAEAPSSRNMLHLLGHGLTC